MILPDDPSSRRDFLKQAAITSLSLAAAGQLGCAAGGGKGAWGAAAAVQKEDVFETPPKLPELRIALIGTGGIGGYHIESIVEHEVQVPCYCDVDTGRYEKAAKQWPKAKTYQDYREMFDKEHKNFDAVMIGVPDHHHYPATMMAMQLGKHVYTQKPLTHTPWEAKQLAESVGKYKLATQMGNQGHAGEGWRLVYEFIRSGKLGNVVETHTWTDRPIWPQGMERPEGTDAVPANLNWDVWLGPAPQRTYKEKVYHPFVWRGWWDFGCGALGDMACHTMDGIFWGLDPGAPDFVEPTAATPITADAYPNASIVHWRFPRKGGRPAFDAYWYDGNLHPAYPPELEHGRTYKGTGTLFIGTKNTLFVQGDYGDSPRIIPEAKMKTVGKPPKMLPRSCGHILEWLLAAAQQRPIDYPKSNFTYSGPMTKTVLLGNIALRLGRRLEWDEKKWEFPNAPEANAYLTKEYREGWRV